MQPYNIFTFGSMLGPRNKPRVDAYVEALRRSVTPGCTVLDIGTGVGFFAVLAAKFGAGRVHGVDPNPYIKVAREIAAANGVADRVTFNRGLSTDLDLPQRADVIISDIRGALPWLHHHISSIVDARERLLAKGGVLIPARDHVWAAVVEAPSLYAKYASPWDDNEYGLDLSAARVRATEVVRKGHVTSDALLVEPARVASLDYATITDANLRATLNWTADRAGDAHGLSVWFDTELVAGVGYSNAPTEPHIPMYSQVFFPWRTEVALAPGDEITVTLRAHLVGVKYVWGWSTRVCSATGTSKASFDQSNFGAEDLGDESDPARV